MVDWEALLDVVVASLVVVTGVTIMFSLAIYGATRFAEMRRDGTAAGAVGYAVLAPRASPSRRPRSCWVSS